MDRELNESFMAVIMAGGSVTAVRVAGIPTRVSQYQPGDAPRWHGTSRDRPRSFGDLGGKSNPQGDLGTLRPEPGRVVAHASFAGPSHWWVSGLVISAVVLAVVGN